MGDEENLHKVEYLDTPDGLPDETNWIKRAGKAKVTYPNESTFEGIFDAERIKQGPGVYIWMAPGPDDDETPVEKARYEGNYVDGMRTGLGRMVYPNGDTYEGEFFENKMQGEGSYTYKKTNDIYSGTWVNNKKQGEGRYEFGQDTSILNGVWENGQMVTGMWELKKQGTYKGDFERSRPLGQGRFSFANGLYQDGMFVKEKVPEEEEETVEEGEEPKPPRVEW
eukprot:CAMPEP_0182428752 /NCGR_PEP_ID=MMETSP1167-20130531/23342_1 /TAXON_ID=2988 /ORGANISM="Mallomonas Sp, Strain CCMP3275" /LENGTH=223 /DNA_ID=CAMNT_0024611817 /DNA_START=126 /DNA_END=794 /DNA_ORIENTATION=+